MATKKTHTNPFDKFIRPDEKKAFIKSLDYEITYRPLTAIEDDEYSIRLMKGVTKDSKSLNVEEGIKIKYEKISKMLIDPKITEDELKDLDASVNEAIVEILAVLEKDENVDDEGNSKS